MVAVIVQALLATRAGLPVLPVLALSGLGCLLGFLGGKVWWLVVNRRPVRDFLGSGACVQGFLLAALAVLVTGTIMLGVSVGAVLDATAPGIFLGMAVGRPGCFLTGRCVGRPTVSRWGLWSSDRRLGIRRIPVQLYEAAAALLIGGAGLALVLGVRSPFPGAVFVGTIATYTLSRQFLFLLRTNSHTRWGRVVVQGICGVVLLGLLIAYLGIYDQGRSSGDKRADELRSCPSELRMDRCTSAALSVLPPAGGALATPTRTAPKVVEATRRDPCELAR